MRGGGGSHGSSDISTGAIGRLQDVQISPHARPAFVSLTNTFQPFWTGRASWNTSTQNITVSQQWSDFAYNVGRQDGYPLDTGGGLSGLTTVPLGSVNIPKNSAFVLSWNGSPLSQFTAPLHRYKEARGTDSDSNEYRNITVSSQGANVWRIRGKDGYDLENERSTPSLSEHALSEHERIGSGVQIRHSGKARSAD